MWKKIFKTTVKSRYKKLKTVDDLIKTAKNDSTLKSIIKKIPIKKTVVAGGLTATAILVGNEVTRFLNDNTGCFLNKKCKIKELSCCNQQGTRFCTEKFDLNACQGYDVKDSDCCKRCNALLYPNLPKGSTLKCQRPTVYDALVHLTPSFLPLNLIFMCIGILILIIFFFKLL